VVECYTGAKPGFVDAMRHGEEGSSLHLRQGKSFPCGAQVALEEAWRNADSGFIGLVARRGRCRDRGNAQLSAYGGGRICGVPGMDAS